MCSVTESLLQCPIQVKEAVSKADSQRVGIFSEYDRDGKAGESEAQQCCVTDGCFLLGTALGYRTKADCLTTKWKGHLGKYKKRDAQCKTLALPLPTQTQLWASPSSVSGPVQNLILPFSLFSVRMYYVCNKKGEKGLGDGPGFKAPTSLAEDPGFNPNNHTGVTHNYLNSGLRGSNILWPAQAPSHIWCI